MRSTHCIGTLGSFFIVGVISVVALIFLLVCVPETKGLPIEEIEKMLEMRSLHYKFWENNSSSLDNKKKGQSL
ncbi:hypothetical protein CsatB_001854 [Cannabis sativa]